MLIDRYGPDALISSGVAAGLLPNMRIGDLVVASHLIQYDKDLTVIGRRHGELSGENGMIESARSSCRRRRRPSIPRSPTPLRRPA